MQRKYLEGLRGFTPEISLRCLGNVSYWMKDMKELLEIFSQLFRNLKQFQNKKLKGDYRRTNSKVSFINK
jgi:hypothetical protein